MRWWIAWLLATAVWLTVVIVLHANKVNVPVGALFTGTLIPNCFAFLVDSGSRHA